MKRIIQISNNWNEEQVTVLRQYGLNIEEGFFSLLVDADRVEPRVLSLLENWDVLIGRGVEFEKKEILSAEYCILIRFNTCGYPMPDCDFGFRDLTYSNTKDYCANCDIQKKQKDDFRIKQIPKSKFWTLEWVYDEFFVDKDVYDTVFKPFGVDCRNVKHYKDDSDVSSFVQLIIPEIEQNLDLGDYEYNTCKKCGRIKYDPSIKGYFPLQETPTLHIYKSHEFFGSGSFAYKRIFVSAQLRDKMLEYKLVKLNYFAPCSQVQKRPL